MQQPWKDITLSDLPLREDLKLRHAYGAPQLDVPVCLNVNENPYPPSPALVARIATAVADAARANRYPDRDFAELRTHLAAYLMHDTGVAVDASSVWAANGSNEVIQQILQAFGGPGRSALAFTPAYPMYDEYCRTTFTRLHTLPRTRDFALDLDRPRQHPRAPAERHPADVAEQPDRHRAAGRRYPRDTRRRAGRGGRRRGLCGIPASRRPQRGDAAAGASPAHRHPHVEQGVQVRGRPRRVLRVCTCDRRSAEAGSIALPPVRVHPGGGLCGAGRA